MATHDAHRVESPEGDLLSIDRLRAVRASGLLEVAVEQSWDQLTKLAASLLRAPIALLSLADESRSHWLSSVGVAPGGPGVPIDQSFCQYVIADRAPFVVSDTAVHARTSANETLRQLGVRAWAGHPLFDASGHVLGSFCVVDVVTRSWTPEELDVLAVLSAAAAAQLQLVSAVRAERRAEDRLQRLTGVALELVTAGSVADLTEIVVNRALPVLGADGGAVVVRQDDGSFTLAVSDRLGDRTQVAYGSLPADDPLPACHVARTGQRLQLPTRAEGLAFAPAMADVYETTGRAAWVFSPLTVGDQVLGSLAVAWVEERALDEDELTLVDALAAQCGQALARIGVAEQQRLAALEVQQLAESLQQALLTPPPQPEHLHVAVRYRPAGHHAQVGGDWYDAFLQPDGATMLVIGDVVGHDRVAAAQMGQLRGLLRALAYAPDSTAADTPAGVLTRVEHAARALAVDTLATVVLASVGRHPDVTGRGSRTLRWSNAGHLPPVVLHADGTSTLLDTPADLLLGVDPTTDRHDHTYELPDDSTLLMFTDGLVERRGSTLDEGLRTLQEALVGLAAAPLDELCDTVLDRLVLGPGEDDVALLAVRTHAGDGQRPRSATATSPSA
ncbi:MAG TPA: GAF domain-containing SpoIIE family protein phosphatase [Actinomycetales bacterium]|jgi:serine phosphatase RsbU (regulator of sigma subunit)